MLSRDTIKYIPILEGIWIKSMVHNFAGKNILFPRKHLAMSGDSFPWHYWKVPYCTSIWWLRPVMLLNIPQCTRQLPTTKNYQPKALIVTRLRNYDEMTTVESSLILSFSKAMGKN